MQHIEFVHGMNSFQHEDTTALITQGVLIQNIFDN